MNCPGCGAAMRLVESRRHFRCEHCGTFHFPEETGDGVAVLDAPAGGDCPVCRRSLVQALLEGEQVAYCEQCRGFLTAQPAFARIVTRRRAKHGPNERRVEPFDATELRRKVNCPRCDRRMETHAYGGGGNAVVDSCERCRLVWLDAGELAVIERYLPHQHKIEPGLNLPGAAGPGAAVWVTSGGGLLDPLLEDLF